MATMVVSVAGTWGEVLPLAVLAQGLQYRGHSVRFVVNKAQHDLIREVGLQPFACGRPYGLRQARRVLRPRKGWSPVIAELKKAQSFLTDTPAQYRDLLKACRGADLLIGHSFQYAAMLVHDQLGIPWACVSVTPGQFEHSESFACTQPAPPATLNLLASSPHFSNPDRASNERLRVTGFLFFDGSSLKRWQPDAKLRSFLEQGEKVLVLSLGCLPGPDAQRLALLCVRVARRLERRLVIQPGWSVVDARKLASDQVCVAGPVPHDWLLSHAAAFIHHGGIGLCARALRNGVPMLLLPQRQDQYFNARAVLASGAGAAAAVPKVTGKGLCRILEERVLAPACRRAAGRMAAKLRREHGLRKACAEVERLLK